MANAGRVAIVPKGDYSSSTAYNRLDLVRYNEKAYVAKKANTGVAPTNTEYWMLMTSDGITIDAALSDTSTNPVQNKVVKTAIDNIQTTSRATLSQAGWYRVAEYVGRDINAVKGARSNSCEIIIKRGYGDNPNEEHRLLLNSAYNSQAFDAVSCFSISATYHYVTKIRYTYDTANKAYIEVYYSGSNANDMVIIINDGLDLLHNWKAIEPTITSETVSGVTVTTTYDIPANASPVTDLDIGYFEKWKNLPSDTYMSIDDIPSGAWKISSSVCATITNMPEEYTSGVCYAIVGDKVDETFVQLINPHSFKMWVRKRYANIYTWSKPIATTADLANYLPKTGGAIDGFVQINNASETPFVVHNSNSSAHCYVGFKAGGTELGYFGFQTGMPYVMSANGSGVVHHDGNSAKVVIQESAPTDTSALWVDTANKVTKAYIDGAWTQVA